MRRGLTLVEVLVVSAVFIVLAFLLLAIYQVAVRAHLKEDAHDTTARATMLALEHVREELRGCQVLEPNDPTAPAANQVRFRYPKLDETGVFVVDNHGEPEWAGTATMATDADGNLVLTRSEAEPRTLARLGAGGGVTFRLAEALLLEVKVVAVRPDPDPSKSARSEILTRMALANQP